MNSGPAENHDEMLAAMAGELLATEEVDADTLGLMAAVDRAGEPEE